MIWYKDLLLLYSELFTIGFPTVLFGALEHVPWIHIWSIRTFLVIYIVDPSWSRLLYVTRIPFGHCTPLNYSLFCWTNQRFSTLVSTRRHPREVEYVVTWKKRFSCSAASQTHWRKNSIVERHSILISKVFEKVLLIVQPFRKKLGKRSRVRKQKTFVVHQIFMASRESVLCGTFLLLHWLTN